MSMESEFARISTFRSWPHPGQPLRLARRGFYYGGRGRSVTCYQCRLDFEDWQEIEELLAIHRVRSPGCTLSSAGCEDGRRQGVVNNSANPTRDETDFTALASQQAKFENTSLNLARRDTVENKPAAPADPNFDQLRVERVRLETFHNWPHTAARVVDPRDLAEAGLFYTGQQDRVQCAFCRGFLRNWIRGDRPKDEHRKHFPDCPFVRGLDVGNVRSVDGDVSSDTGGATATLTSSVTPSYQAAAAAAPSTINRPRPPGVMRRNRTKATGFESLTRRLGSYRGRRVGSGQTAEGLAQAGFFYIGPGDKVRCFCCDGVVNNWTATDDPWTVHVARYPECGYIQEQQKLIREFEADRRHSRAQQNGGDRQPTQDGSAETETYAQTVLDENARLRMNRVCKICYNRDVTTVFMPCGHTVCSDCLTQLQLLTDYRCHMRCDIYGTLRLRFA